MNNTYYKLISLNIEGHRHLKRFVPYIKEQRADIICLQEVFESDMELFKKEFGMEGVFAPMSTTDMRTTGVALFTRGSLNNVQYTYYVGDKDTLHSRVLLHGDYNNIHIGTTHFTVSDYGQIDALQRKHLKLFLEKLSHIPDIIFCGDLNAPRGRELFSAFAEKYIDHIPKHYTTSLDQEIHRAGPLELMVDGLFSTPEYGTKDVEFVCGLSDHCAIIGNIIKK